MHYNSDMIVQCRRSACFYRKKLGRTLQQQLMMRLMFILIVLFLMFLNKVVISVEASDEEYSQFVQEIISEDELYFNEYNNEQIKDETQHIYDHDSEEYTRAEEEERIETESIRMKQERNDQIHKEREDALATELDQLKVHDEIAAKKFIQQKKRDTKLVNRIQKASKINDHYAVLGIQTFIQRLLPPIRIPKRSITIIPNTRFVLQIPEIQLFTISESTIKKAYREMAKLIHPDKCKDPRATETFFLLDHAATILLTPQYRLEYDTKLQQERDHQRAVLYQQIQSSISQSIRMIHHTFRIGKKILGPFTVPVIILVALIA